VNIRDTYIKLLIAYHLNGRKVKPLIWSLEKECYV